jgi:hypothetical protein
MRYQCIALICILLLAAAMNAVTNIVPALHPPQCQTKMMHLVDVISAAAAPKGAWRTCK